MTPAEQDLARQLAKHPAWRWVEGMRAVGAASNGSIAIRVSSSRIHGSYAPDLADQATQGCLLAALMASCGHPCGVKPGDRMFPDEGWEVTCWHGLASVELIGHGRTLGEALARAWLAVVNHD